MTKISSDGPWVLGDALTLCRMLEPWATMHNCHVALTGGLLYKDGPRKDCDVVVYRRGLCKGEEVLPEFDRDALTKSFKNVLKIVQEFGRVTKCTFDEKPVDLLFVNTIGVPHDLAGDSA